MAGDVQAALGEAWEIFADAAIWNSTARVEAPKPQDGAPDGYTGTESAALEYQGNVTEVGILKFFAGVMGIEGVQKRKLALTEDMILCRVPFDAGRKRGSIVVKKPDGGVRVFTKGAPDVLFGKDKAAVEDKKAEIRESDSSMTDAEVKARAEKQVGYGMVRWAATPGGREDWTGPATAENLESLAEITRLGGNTQSDHEDLFKACVKDYAL